MPSVDAYQISCARPSNQLDPSYGFENFMLQTTLNNIGHFASRLPKFFDIVIVSLSTSGFDQFDHLQFGVPDLLTASLRGRGLTVWST